MRRALLTGPGWGEIYALLSGTELHKSPPRPPRQCLFPCAVGADTPLPGTGYPWFLASRPSTSTTAPAGTRRCARPGTDGTSGRQPARRCAGKPPARQAPWPQVVRGPVGDGGVLALARVLGNMGSARESGHGRPERARPCRAAGPTLTRPRQRPRGTAAAAAREMPAMAAGPEVPGDGEGCAREGSAVPHGPALGVPCSTGEGPAWLRCRARPGSTVPPAKHLGRCRDGWRRAARGSGGAARLRDLRRDGWEGGRGALRGSWVPCPCRNGLTGLAVRAGRWGLVGIRGLRPPRRRGCFHRAAGWSRMGNPGPANYGLAGVSRARPHL